jgi:hypothetical protein
LDQTAAFSRNFEVAVTGDNSQDVFIQQLRSKIDSLLPAGGQHALSGDIEKAAKIFHMGVKQTAFGLFAQNKDGHFFAGSMDGCL